MQPTMLRRCSQSSKAVRPELAVALAVVEGDPSPENDGGGEEASA